MTAAAERRGHWPKVVLLPPLRMTWANVLAAPAPIVTAVVAVMPPVTASVPPVGVIEFSEAFTTFAANVVPVSEPAAAGPTAIVETPVT